MASALLGALGLGLTLASTAVRPLVLSVGLGLAVGLTVALAVRFAVALAPRLLRLLGLAMASVVLARALSQHLLVLFLLLLARSLTSGHWDGSSGLCLQRVLCAK